MAKSSEEWNRFEMTRDEWQQAIVALEKATVRERELRWKLNESARKLEAMQSQFPD